MTKLLTIIFIIAFIAIASHLDFLTEVQCGKAFDHNGKQITMQDATWFCEKF